jgi:ribosomal protein L11 methyltransferase
MTWLQLRLDTRADKAPEAEEAMLALGAAAVTLQDNADQPLFAGASPSEVLWQHTRVSGLFPADSDLDNLTDALRQSLADEPGDALRVEILEDKDWEREWMQYYQPLEFGRGLWLCPSWLEPPDPEAVTVMLDPGLAFGTGTHPTTAMCLELLAGESLDQQRVVDFGCGSGVLGIAALKLGAREVLATDTDPQALTATWANAETNHIAAGRLRVVHPDALDGEERAELVIANILAGPLCELAPTLCDMLETGGRLLLSGVLETQVEELRAAYPLPLAIVARRDGWVALSGVKP